MWIYNKYHNGVKNRHAKNQKSRWGGNKTRKAQRKNNCAKARQERRGVRADPRVLEPHDDISIRDANIVDIDGVNSDSNIDVDNTSVNSCNRSSEEREPSPKQTRIMSRQANLPLLCTDSGCDTSCVLTRSEVKAQ